MTPKAITVGELIAELSKFPADLPVMVNGYEGGYDYPSLVQVQRMYPGWNDEEMSELFGRYENPYGDDDKPQFDTVVIER